MQFPDHLRKQFLNTKWGCDVCEMSFELVEFNPATGKKSKTWILGTTQWGSKDARFCDVLVIKCPHCGNPRQNVIISQGRPLSELVEKQLQEQQKPQAPPPNKVTTNGSNEPLTASPRIMRRGEPKKPDEPKK